MQVTGRETHEYDGMSPIFFFLKISNSSICITYETAFFWFSLQELYNKDQIVDSSAV